MLFRSAIPLTLDPSNPASPANPPPSLQWILSDGTVLNSNNNPDGWRLEIPKSALPVDRLVVGPSSPTKPGGFWSDVLVRNFPQFIEPIDSQAFTGDLANPLAMPVGISGRLSKAGEVDSYVIAGTQGQVVRIRAKTRSIGLATLLKMTLSNASGATVAETPVDEADEWGFEFTFPDTAAYQLRVSDLLKRGGPTFAYWIEVTNQPWIKIAIKPDPNTRESRILEPISGATFLDVTIQTSGYQGPFQFELQPAIPGLRIINPNVPARVTDHRLFFACDQNLEPTAIGPIRLIAKQAEGGDGSTLVSTLPLKIGRAHV